MVRPLPGDAPTIWIADLVRSLCAVPENAMQGPFNEPAWAEPLVGYSRGDDLLYAALKTHVGPEQWTPLEAMELAYPGETFDAAHLTVVSWVLPQTEATKADNRAQTVYPAERWARSRMFGEAFNNALKHGVVSALREMGLRAVSPTVMAEFHSTDSVRYVYASTWSERHVAHASGLGTFGLCDGLITPLGKAMRLGSIVVDLPVEATERPYSDHHAYCLYYAQGTCGVCMQRCPVGAITPGGHDKRLCKAHLDTTRPIVREQYGFEGYACGLCQTGTPCESGIPDGLNR